MPADFSTQHKQTIVTSLLENEGLTSNLDDSAANVLLDWGIACAGLLAQQYRELPPIDAEAAMYPQLKATRRLMRLLNRWVPQRLEMDSTSNAGSLTKVIEQAAIIYGADFVPPTARQKEAFLTNSISKTAPQFITDLRQLIEASNSSSSTNAGKTDG